MASVAHSIRQTLNLEEYRVMKVSLISVLALSAAGPYLGRKPAGGNVKRTAPSRASMRYQGRPRVTGRPR